MRKETKAKVATGVATTAGLAGVTAIVYNEYTFKKSREEMLHDFDTDTKLAVLSAVREMFEKNDSHKDKTNEVVFEVVLLLNSISTIGTGKVSFFDFNKAKKLQAAWDRFMVVWSNIIKYNNCSFDDDDRLQKYIQRVEDLLINKCPLLDGEVDEAVELINTPIDFEEDFFDEDIEEDLREIPEDSEDEPTEETREPNAFEVFEEESKKNQAKKNPLLKPFEDVPKEEAVQETTVEEPKEEFKDTPQVHADTAAYVQPKKRSYPNKKKDKKNVVIAENKTVKETPEYQVNDIADKVSEAVVQAAEDHLQVSATVQVPEEPVVAVTEETKEEAPSEAPKESATDSKEVPPTGKSNRRGSNNRRNKPVARTSASKTASTETKEAPLPKKGENN